MPAGISAYVPLANITTSTQISTVSFSGIDQSYTDLVCVAYFSTVNSGGSPTPGVYLNGVFNNASYRFVTADGHGGGAYSSYTYTGAQMVFQDTAIVSNSTCLAIFQAMDYSSTTKHKIVLGRINGVASTASFGVGKWQDTAAITTFSLRFSGLAVDAGATFTLYGVKA